MKLKLTILCAAFLAANASAVNLDSAVTHGAPTLVSTNGTKLEWHDLRPVTNRVWLAKPKKDKGLAALTAFIAFGTKHKWLKNVDLIRFEDSDENANRRFKESGLFEYVVPDRKVQVQEVAPNDPLWTNQWDMTKIQMPAAWGVNTGNTNVIVAVIDTGIDFTHPDLAANLWTNPTNGTHGYQCYGGDLREGGADVFGHGTHCAGTIAAVGNNAVGIAGINWRLRLLSMAFLDQYGSGYSSDAAVLIDQLIAMKRTGQNIVVTSDSWGGFGIDPALVDAFQALEDAGIVSACAAGNSALNIDLVPNSPGGQTNRGIISVSASDRNDVLAGFSDYGLVNVDIAAPGAGTLSTESQNTNLTIHSSSGYGYLSGTSMATPHVAGVLALLAASNPSLTVYQLKDALLNQANYDSLDFGNGQFSTTGGRLNAYKVLSNPTAPANHAPVVIPSSPTNIVGGQIGQISFSAQDADGDPLRYAILEPNNIISFTADNTANFAVPHYAIPAAFQAYEEASDRNGGGDLKIGIGNILIDPSYSTDRYEIIMRSNLVDRLHIELGDDYVSNSNTNVQAYRSAVFVCGADGRIGGNFGGSPSPIGSNDYLGTWVFPDDSEWSMFVVAKNGELTIKETPRLVFKFGSKTNDTHSFPRLAALFDRTSGQSPLTVNYDFGPTVGANGPYQFWIWDLFSDASPINQAGSMTFSNAGLHQVTFLVQDGQGYTDTKTVLFSALAVVTNVAPPPPPGLNQVTNLVVLDLGHSAQLTWTDNSTGEDRYLLEVSKKSKGQWNVVANLELPANSASFLYSPSSGGFFRFRVRAAAGLQYAPWSAYTPQIKL